LAPLVSEEHPGDPVHRVTIHLTSQLARWIRPVGEPRESGNCFRFDRCIRVCWCREPFGEWG